MAINKTPTSTDENLFLEINNGDLVALKNATEKWSFKDMESAMRFALAVLTVTNEGTLFIDRDGLKVSMSPGQELLNKKED